MTLTELLPEVMRLSQPEKIKLIQVLAEELDASEDASPLEPGKVYYVATPYNAFGAAQALMDALEASSEK
jgi:hypothetical protein